jgi:hypothetical protein
MNYQMFSRDAQQVAYNFVVNQTTAIEARVIKMQYPDVQYPDLVPSFPPVKRRAIAERDPQMVPWLRAWLAREIHDRPAALIAVAAHPACAQTVAAYDQGAIVDVHPFGKCRCTAP